jgi:hypothetical protein
MGYVMLNLAEIFGEPIHIYSRTQALEDGVLIDVSKTAKEAGFRIPVALTHAVWVDCVEWVKEEEKAIQDEEGRLWDVVFMSALAAQRANQEGSAQVLLMRVPRGGVRPQVVKLNMVVGAGDTQDPVITIMQQGED